MSSKIDAYLELDPASFTRLVRLEVVPSAVGPGEAIDLVLEVGRDDGARLVLRFVGITELKVDDLRSSRPDFLEISDMRVERGWESMARFAVSDCCQGPLSFYCTDFSADMVE